MDRELKDISINELGLSVRAVNALTRAGVSTLEDLLKYDEESLFALRNLGVKTVNEILDVKKHFMPGAGTELTKREGVLGLLDELESREKVLEYVRINDIDIDDLGLSNRARNQLKRNGYSLMSEIVLLSKEDLSLIPALGESSVNDITSVIEQHLNDHESAIVAFCSGDGSALLNDEVIRDRVLALYKDIGFKGLSFKEITEGLDFPEAITEERLKKIIGSLIRDKQLEYVDFRCHRAFEKFCDILKECPKLSDRDRGFIEQRLDGITLEEIGKANGLTRERVRQLVNKGVKKIQDYYFINTGLKYFDEDYYGYFYSTYFFDKKDGIKWFGVEPYIWNYLDMRGLKLGNRELSEALDDSNIDLGFRLKIKNYLNRNRLYLDKEWVDNKRASVENFILKKLCREDVTFDDFVKIYNDYLEQQGVPYDPSVYITDEVKPTRLNRLSESRTLLWKINEKLRYYDIDGRDYTELFDTLNLASYENIEFSTAKFMEGYPDIMEKYDIRDQYELHNLLRKTVKDGDFHDFHCGRMPMIRFGAFDRDLAILKILIANSPATTEELCDLIHDEYGYDQATTMGLYLGPISEYYHNGVYSIDYKTIPRDRMEVLAKNLPGDFYYMNEIGEIYSDLYDDAKPEEINPYVLRKIGFSVFSNYVMKGYDSLESYFTELLTAKDVIDISALRSRYTYVTTFTNKLMELKRNLRMIEYEPNKLISITRLEQAGVTKEAIKDYCDKVYDFVEEDRFFSIQSIRNEGFEIPSVMDELGFSDWFYGSLLISDNRFSFGNFFANLVFIKGKRNITIKEFAYELIRENEVMDRYDLLSELQNTYGCQVKDFTDIYYKIQDTGVRYDKILDRIYLNEDLYYQEIGGMEEL